MSSFTLAFKPHPDLLLHDFFPSPIEPNSPTKPPQLLCANMMPTKQHNKTDRDTEHKTSALPDTVTGSAQPTKLWSHWHFIGGGLR